MQPECLWLVPGLKITAAKCIIAGAPRQTADMNKRLIELGHLSSEGPQTRILAPDPASPTLECAKGLPGIVLQSTGPAPHEIRAPFHDSQIKGKAVLIRTGWDRYWGSEEYDLQKPSLSADVIFRLIRSGAKLVGVDFPANFAAEQFVVVDNLCNLSALPPIGFTFYAVQEVAGPARAYADIIS